MYTKNPLTRCFYKSNILNLSFAILGTTVLSGAILCVPQMIQLLIDYFAGQRTYTMQSIIFMSIGVLFLEIFSGICTYCFRTRFSAKAVSQYRKCAYEYISKKRIADFYNRKTSIYISALTNDINKIKEAYLDQIPIITQVIICGIGAVAIMIRYNFFLAIIACLFSFIPFCSALIAGRKLPVLEENLSRKNAEYTGFLKDFSLGYTIIRSYKVETVFAGIHSSVCDKTACAMLQREKNVEKINYFAAISGYITQFLVLFVCAFVAYTKGTITAGTVIAFSQLIRYVIDPVTELPSMLMEAKSAYTLSNKFWTAIKTDDADEITEKKGKIHDGEIFLNNISYYYDNEDTVLNHFNLKIQTGEKIAIIGGSGSGKSTILKLIMGIVLPQRGNVFVSNNDISEVEETEIFRQIAYIQQDVFIFDGSIYDNITLFQKYEDCELNRAIEKAGLKDLVLEKGLDYMCGENGAALSGGERQRINIARSLLRRTKILLADEITAALDKETGFHVLDAVTDIEQITEVLVLHNMDRRILDKVDRVIAIRDGKIVESGSFAELMMKKGYVYSLYTIDTKEQ